MKVFYEKDIGYHIPYNNGYIPITLYAFRDDGTAFERKEPVALIEHKKEEV